MQLTPENTSAAEFRAVADQSPQQAARREPPWKISMKTARTRARTQSGAIVWTSALNSEMKAIQAPPASSITSASARRPRAMPVSAIVAPSIAIAVETTASIDHRARAALTEQGAGDRAGAETAKQQAVHRPSPSLHLGDGRQKGQERAAEEHHNAGSQRNPPIPGE